MRNIIKSHKENMKIQLARTIDGPTSLQITVRSVRHTRIELVTGIRPIICACAIQIYLYVLSENLVIFRRQSFIYYTQYTIIFFRTHTCINHINYIL